MEIIINKPIVEPADFGREQLIEYQKKNTYLDITYHTWIYVIEYLAIRKIIQPMT
jgi:hypothetical protein